MVKKELTCDNLSHIMNIAWRKIRKRRKNMPTKTFLNLPDEKKRHLLECAKEEFTRNTLRDASINKIIQDAGIPRGSFYQYFEDKEDIYFYIFNMEKENILAGLKSAITRQDTMKESFLKMYKFLYNYIIKTKQEDYYRNVMITFHKLETPPTEKKFFFDETLKQVLKEKVTLEDKSTRDLLEVMSFSLSRAVIDSLKEKNRQKEIENRFKNLLEIFENGYKKEGGDNK